MPRTPPPKPSFLIKENSHKPKDISRIEKINDSEKKDVKANRTEESSKTPPVKRSDSLATPPSPAKKFIESPTPPLRASRRSRNNSGSESESVIIPKSINSGKNKLYIVIIRLKRTLLDNSAPIPRPRTISKEPSPVPKPRLSKEFKETKRTSSGETSSSPLLPRKAEKPQKISPSEQPLESPTKLHDIKRSQTTRTNRVTPEAEKSKRRSVDVEILAANDLKNSPNDVFVKNVEEENKKINEERDKKREKIIDTDKTTSLAADKENLTRHSSVVEKGDDAENCSKIAEELTTVEKEKKGNEPEPIIFRRTLSVGKDGGKVQTEGEKKQPEWITLAQKRSSTWKDPDENCQEEEVKDKNPAVSAASSAKTVLKRPMSKLDPAITEAKDDKKTLPIKPAIRKSDGNEDKKPIISKPKPLLMPKEFRAEALAKSSEADLVKPSDLHRTTHKTSQNSSTSNLNDSPPVDKADKENKPKVNYILKNHTIF